MQFLPYVGLLSMTMAGGLVGTGCSNIDAGHLTDPEGPPKLIRVMVQDAVVGGANERVAATDLYDDGPLVSCNAENPCQVLYEMARNAITINCSDPNGGTCPDPLHAGPIKINPPPGAAGGFGGTAVRLVFNKILKEGIETVTTVPGQIPNSGKDLTYQLVDGIAKITGPDGMELPSDKRYEAGGPPKDTSDPIFVPYGPAIVVKPKAPLEPGVTYTIHLNGMFDGLTDRSGAHPVNRDGSPIGSDFTVNFTTENLAKNDANSFPALVDANGNPAEPTLTPDEIFQFAFWSSTDPGTVTASVSDSTGAAVTVVSNIEYGSDPTMCGANGDNTFINVTHTSDAAGATPVDWAAGEYTLKFSVKDASGRTTFTSPDIKFKVAGDKMMGDTLSYTQHVTKAQCNPQP